MKSLQSYVPILDWLPSYQRSWLRTDLMAGLAVWAMTVPQVLAYAGIANVPAIYALYSVPLAMIAYAVFGTSRTLTRADRLARCHQVRVLAGPPSAFFSLQSIIRTGRSSSR